MAANSLLQKRGRQYSGLWQEYARTDGPDADRRKAHIGDLFALEGLLEKFGQHIQAFAEMQGFAWKPVDHVSATKLDFQHLMTALHQPISQQGKKRAGDPLQKQEFFHRTPTT
jgi:hypothetical protein